MDENKQIPPQETDDGGDAVENTQNTIRAVGRVILGTLAATLVAEFFGLKKRK